MLELTVKPKKLFDSDKECFVNLPGASLTLEHSLSSLSKWESKYEKPFLSSLEQHKKKPEEMVDYFRMMTINLPEVDIYPHMDSEEINTIGKYINAKNSATWFKHSQDSNVPTRTKIITAEVIYGWMVGLNIPFETENWHLNRLLTLVQVVNINNTPQDKKKSGMTAAQRRELNEQRLSRYVEGG